MLSQGSQVLKGTSVDSQLGQGQGLGIGIGLEDVVERVHHRLLRATDAWESRCKARPYVNQYTLDYAVRYEKKSRH